MSQYSAPSPLRPDLSSEWMLDPRVTFLNHGSFGAVPRKVFDEQTQWRRRIEAEPIELLGRQAQELLAAARQPIGTWLGMNADDFGFVTNATEGVNAVLKSLALEAGDELLTTNHVYNAVRQTMRHTASRWGATYREVELPLPIRSDEEIAATIASQINSRTRLLVVDHVSSPTALVFPVEKIVARCAAQGVDVLVDGAHAPGMLQLNISAIGAAYYAGNLHKWTCAPRGSGFLYVRADRQTNIHPLVISHDLGEGFAREFAWQGTRDISAWLTVPSAIAFMGDLGWDRVMAHNHQMAVFAQQVLCERWNVKPLSPFDGSQIGSMCTVRLPPPLVDLSREAGLRLQQTLYNEHELEVPIVPWGGQTFVRPCFQVYNRAADCERLAQTIESLARTGWS